MEISDTSNEDKWEDRRPKKAMSFEVFKGQIKDQQEE